MKAISLLTAATITFAGLALTPKADAQVIKIDGSSTVFPITEAVAEEFQIQNRGKIRVTVGISGTGGGFKKFCRGETDISDASRPILTAEMEACRAAGIKYYELPIAYDALTVVVNPQNTWVTQLTIPELKKIWEPAAQGKIKTWNQINPKWPNEPLALFGPGSDSGTFDYFTEAVTGKAQVEPRRLHGQRRRQRAGAGRREQQGRARLLRLRVLRAECRQAEGGADRRQGGQSRRSLARKRRERHATSRCRARSSSMSPRRRRSGPR